MELSDAAVAYGDAVKHFKRAKLDADEKHQAAVLACAEQIRAQRHMNDARRTLDAAHAAGARVAA